MTLIKQNIRPLPYYSLHVTERERVLAAMLRKEFAPKIARRIKGHHLAGFSNDYIISFIRRHKKTHPFYLRTDIAKFYPNVRHRDMIVYTQIAYKELLGLDYVPRAFKQQYVKGINDWCRSLPLQRGIPSFDG